MKNYKHLLALLLTLCMLLCMLPTAFAQETAPLATEDEVVIYYTNDIHTYIDKGLSYDNIADLKAQTAEITDTLLVDAGDHIQGTAYGSMDKGETIAELMAAAGYDLATLGNHEFDYGMKRALEIAKGETPYVSCNFYNEKDGVAGETVLDAYKVFELGGKKIAIIGITTPETFTKSTPAYFQDEDGNYIYGIAGGTDGKALYETVQKAIDAASEEADIVIALGHLGDDPASKPWTSEELISNVTGLDAFIDGHSHSTVAMKEVKDKAGNVVVLTQTGEYFGAIGRMSIADDGTISTGLIHYVDVKEKNEEGKDVVVETYLAYTDATEANARLGWDIGSDAEVKAIKDEWIAEIDEQLGQVIGKAEVTLANHDETGRIVRKQETNTGDFAADALYYLFDSMDMDVDVAIMNGGGIRNKEITGDITYKTCKEIHAFGNVACLQTITGQQLLDALEWGAKDTPNAENGGFLHVSGITYEIHTYIESTVQADEKGVWAGAPTGEYRVKNVKILQDGKYVDLDLKAEYNLAGYNYTLRDLGDGFTMFDGAVNVLDYVMEDYMVLANYIASFPDSVIGKDSGYADLYGAGRIVLVDEEPVDMSILDTFTDVEKDRYYSEALAYMVGEGYIKGMTETTFVPDDTLTRGMLVTVLYRVAGEPSVEGLENPFEDVKEGRYYTNAIIWAASKEIVKGMTETTFEPERMVSREQIATILYRYAGEPKVEGDLSAFADGDKVSNFAKDAMIWATQQELIKGLPVGDKVNVDAAGKATRAQAVTILYRYGC